MATQWSTTVGLTAEAVFGGASSATVTGAATIGASPALAATSKATMTGPAMLSVGTGFGAIPASLFGLLQTFMEAEEEDPALREQGVAFLLAYVAATSASGSGKSYAVEIIQQVFDAAIVMLQEVYGQRLMPTGRPNSVLMAEIMTAVAAKRGALGFAPLPPLPRMN